MKDKIAWTLLCEEKPHGKKLKDLQRDFDKLKHSVDITTPRAKALMEEFEKLEALGGEYITYIDEDYPRYLREISSPPAYLYVRGNKKLLNHPLKVTMAGSREASIYGINVAMDFARETAINNICIVTGGARGIDTAALRGALNAGGKVICVIGTGIDIDYPPENKELFDTIAKKGVIVSEQKLGMGVKGYNFPMRNRIMTALGDSVVIVEAAEKSGALISAAHATEQGKTLFAVPGNIDSPNSKGTNALLKDGALMALSGDDIVDELIERMPDSYREAQNYTIPKNIPQTYDVSKKEPAKAFSPYEQAVLNAIKSGKETFEEIRDFCEMDVAKLTSVLTILEIKGIIKFAFNNRYKING